MDDLISRAEAIGALKRKQDDGKGDLSRFYNTIIQHDIEAIMQLPPIQPDNGLQKLADEIASFKRCVKSENSDYLTGYLCALSVVEGMIAERREVNNESN